MSERKGLIIVYTGDGKGKTTAALGAALRAASRGMKTFMIQFLKEKGASAEQDIPPSLSEQITIYPCGKGFVFDGDDITPHKEAAEAGWRFMEEELKRNKYDILILDEIAAALNLHLLSTESIKTFLTHKDRDIARHPHRQKHARRADRNFRHCYGNERDKTCLSERN